MSATEQHPGPWRWYRDHNGFGTLRDAAGVPLIIPVTTAFAQELAVSPYVRALTEAAPEMLALLRRLTLAYNDPRPGVLAKVTSDARALLARLDTHATLKDEKP